MHACSMKTLLSEHPARPRQAYNKSNQVTDRPFSLITYRNTPRNLRILLMRSGHSSLSWKSLFDEQKVPRRGKDMFTSFLISWASLAFAHPDEPIQTVLIGKMFPDQLSDRNAPPILKTCRLIFGAALGMELDECFSLTR